MDTSNSTLLDPAMTRNGKCANMGRMRNIAPEYEKAVAFRIRRPHKAPKPDRPMKTIRWHLAHGRHIDIGAKALVMGILNVTPDSFSDGGRFVAAEAALAQAERMAAEGAAIVDVGGESTRPGAAAVSAAEEQARILPVIEALAGSGMLVSVDTYREETARRAVAAGAHIVNDVWGLQREPGIARVAVETGAGLVIMHTSRNRERCPDVIADQFHFLRRSLEIADAAGVAHDRIVLDPGFGFGKETTEENVALMARFEELHALGFPLLAGTSRKRFVGAITGREAERRDVGTAGTSAILRLKGAALFRVHDVATNVDALAVADAILAAQDTSNPTEC
ncbi:dihydropteroate synthase [Mesorhizobium sp. L-8-3]|nr:dihydropteroate synthase [Mesorhizobium sp. L-8-3]